MIAEAPDAILSLRASYDQTASLNDWVAGISARLMLPNRLATRVDLCVTELASNVMSHAYPSGTPGPVVMRYWAQPGQIMIQIEDKGIPFDPTSYRPAAAPTTLDEAEIGGQGLKIVHRFADSINYRRTGNANELTVTFRLSETPKT